MMFEFDIADVGFSHFDVFSGSEVAEQALRYVKPICAHLEKIFNFFEVVTSVYIPLLLSLLRVTP